VQKIHQQAFSPPLHIYFVTDSEKTFKIALKIADQLRDQLPKLRILLNCGGGSFKNQLKKADKNGALYALILGDQEQQNNAITLKSLRKDIPQQTLSQTDLTAHLTKILESIIT